MVDILKPRFINIMVACVTTVAFTTATLTHTPLMANYVNLNLKTINFGIKIEKVFVKIKKSIDKGETNKIIEYMFDIKHEVELYTGQKINLDKKIDQAQEEAKAKGQKIDNKYIKQIKKDFHREEKRYKHQALWFTKCAELDIPYSTEEADMHFYMNYESEKSTKGGDKYIEVPIPIMVGVTVSLCGLFLVFVPLPGCQSLEFG
ncbi:MAG: hypothetical protein Tsb0021_11880 [Chlamydiales bacterium]